MEETMTTAAYVISLDNDVYTEALKRIPLDMTIKKFDAVRGSQLEEYVKNVKNVSIRGQAILLSKYRDSGYDLTGLNSVGCYLSHVSLWDKVVKENLKGMYVFESDAECLGDLDISEFLNTDGDILLFGTTLIGDSFLDPVNHSRKHGMHKIKQHFYGTHAYYITNKGATKALKYAFPIEAQVDAYLSYISKLDLVNIYSCYPNVCNQFSHTSTLQTKPVKHYMDSIVVISGVTSVLLLVIVVLSVLLHKSAKKS